MRRFFSRPHKPKERNISFHDSPNEMRHFDWIVSLCWLTSFSRISDDERKLLSLSLSLSKLIQENPFVFQRERISFFLSSLVTIVSHWQTSVFGESVALSEKNLKVRSKVEVKRRWSVFKSLHLNKLLFGVVLTLFHSERKSLKRMSVK